MGKMTEANSAPVKFRTGKGGRKKLTSLIEWMDSVKWIGYARTDEQTYTLVYPGRVSYPMGYESYSFFTEEKNRIMESLINVVDMASMNYKQDRITNVQMRFSEDPNIRQFFSPLINRIEKLNKLEQDDERLKVLNIFDPLREGTIRFVDDPEHRN